MSCTAWACLVQDELGAQSTLMYRLGLPPGDNYTNARPEWAEWDAELPYNRSRSCTIFQGSLSVFQVRGGVCERVMYYRSRSCTTLRVLLSVV